MNGGNIASMLYDLPVEGPQLQRFHQGPLRKVIPIRDIGQILMYSGSCRLSPLPNMPPSGRVAGSWRKDSEEGLFEHGKQEGEDSTIYDGHDILTRIP